MAKNKKIKNIPQTSGKKPVYKTLSIGILAASDCSHGASV
jgi:hypothetical protein